MLIYSPVNPPDVKNRDPFEINFDYNDKRYNGMIRPTEFNIGHPNRFYVTLNEEEIGSFFFGPARWESLDIEDEGLVDVIGNFIAKRYNQS